MAGAGVVQIGTITLNDPVVRVYRCSQCGTITEIRKSMDVGYLLPGIRVDTEGRQTDHCMVCYGRWIRANVPELVVEELS